MGAEDIRRQQPERAPDARARDGGPPGDQRLGDAQGRGQRGDARLGHERRDDPLRARLGDGTASLSDDRPRPPARDRRRGRRAARGGRGSAARSRPRLRRRRVERDRAARPVHRRADRPAGRRRGGRATGSRPAVTRRPWPVARRASSTAVALADAPGSRRPGRRGPLASAPASTTRGSARRSPRSSPRGRVELAAATDAEALAAVRAVARTEGILPALETAHAFAVLPRLPGRHRGIRRAVPGRDRRPPRVDADAATRTSRRSKTRCPGDRGRRPGAERRAAAPTRRASGTDSTTAGARRIGAAFDRAPARRPGRADPVPRRRLPRQRDVSFAVALAAADAGADLLEVGLPYSDPLADGATLQRASRMALAAGATLDGSIALIERIGAGAARRPARADGLREPGHRRRRRAETVAPRLAEAGASGIIVADLTPDEGGPFEAVARDGRPGRRLSRGADDRTRAPGHDRRPERRLPLLRVARRRHRRPGDACPRRSAGSSATSGPCRPVPVAVGFGVSRPAHVRALAEGRRRRGHRRLGARRRARPGRARRRRPSAGSWPISARRDRPRPDARRSLVVRSARASVQEARPKKVFATAMDWPGWCRAGKTEELALEALAATAALRRRRATRRARVPAATGRRRPRRRRTRRRRRRAPTSGSRASSPSSTDGRPTPADAAPPGAPGRGGLGGLRSRDRRSARPSFARVRAAAAATATRWSPTSWSRTVGYARADRASRSRSRSHGRLPPSQAQRAATLEVLRQPSDGSPLAGRSLDAPLRRPSDRLARPGPRLGDRGPRSDPDEPSSGSRAAAGRAPPRFDRALEGAGGGRMSRR